MNAFFQNAQLKYPVMIGDKVELISANTGRTNVRIPRERYDAMREALLTVIPADADGVAYKDLGGLVNEHLPEWWFTGDHSIAWHIASVKLDLEHRGIIERIPGVRPMRVRQRKGS